ncbi:folate-sensitive fragile site protein Fra10Ac1-domain-containing protein [Hygrophoropsis aurantiaca]|uniref:Folate-sensitive fragile site protein Fra10Ac1-domain-containing protein n=1 Tax=Hygrophoropsis aurantiaca TaxID=72124 RepID=A0ACB8AJG0_9AGAM|nr:folate-sensitive fragile site protein Fra10Ac1-domain-containing protein [Hygrophoropsis aurantiaca]
MALYKPYASSSKATQSYPATTEFEILKASHKFLREDTDQSTSATWNDQLAQKYYDSLYREFAVCDLKHYKSGNFALRWRTESEVLAGTGESTCANTRCAHHETSSVPLSTLELPFAYEEHGARKDALVKVVLCSKCVRKLMWKRKHEKQPNETKDRVQAPGNSADEDEGQQASQWKGKSANQRDSEGVEKKDHHRSRRRSSRSMSPRTRDNDKDTLSRRRGS